MDNASENMGCDRYDKCKEAECVLCGGAMVEGWLEDNTRNEVIPGMWVKGKAEQAWWGGYDRPEEDDVRKICAMRCEKCGHLEFFAIESVVPVTNESAFPVAG